MTMTMVGCSGATEAQSDGDNNAGGMEIDTVAESVNWNASGRYQLDLTDASQVEGYLTYKAKDGNYSPTCGITFISPHFAVTAGHCVDKQIIDTDLTASAGDDKFPVLQFDTRNIVAANGGAFQALIRLNQAAQVTGTWPNYTRGPGMSCGIGYCITMADFSCRVRSRCLPGSNSNCPAALDGMDMALVHCPGRPTTAPWARVFTGNETAGTQIDVHWYHELLDMPSQTNETVGPVGGFDHYTKYDGSISGPFGRLQNYHYQNPGQLQPLLSATFPDGTHYKVLPPPAGTTPSYFGSDAYACHGTSGSGTFLAGTQTFLGPVVGGAGPLANRLCADPAAVAPNVQTMSFVRASKTRVFEQSITFDR